MKDKSTYSHYVCENHLVRKKIHGAEIVLRTFFVDGKMALKTPIEWKHLEIIPTDLPSFGMGSKTSAFLYTSMATAVLWQNFPSLSKNDKYDKSFFTQPDRTILFLIFTSLWSIEVLEIVAQMQQYIIFLSLKPIKTLFWIIW